MEVPTTHTGVHYIEFLTELSKLRGCKNYLEIGVCNGHLLSAIKTKNAIGVDPNFKIDADISHDKKSVTLYQMSSDAYFADKGLIHGFRPDLAFLDGLHTFEFLLRDFYNTEAICDPNALIGMHDCLPLSTTMMPREQKRANELSAGTAFPGWYTGDVWKIVPILKKYRPDLRVICADCHPTGVVFVSNLDPENRILSNNYFQIIDEFSRIGNDEHALVHFYANIETVRASNIIENFDHSLYFKI